jgi:hypothetical protein
MARVNHIVTTFNAGELTPRLDGRVDLDFYRSGCRALENMIPLPQGPATRRPGSRFIAEVKDSAKRTALLPFEFSSLQAYEIEVGDQYFRFYRDKARIESPPGTPVEIATPYQLADLFDADGRLRLKITQSADVLYLCHPNYAPRKLSRTAHTSWTLSLVTFLDGPYLDENVDATRTLTPSATTGSITIAATGHAPFAASDVGRLVRIKHGTTWGHAEITAFTSSTQVSATVKTAFGGTTAQPAWRLGLYSATTGYPAAVTFHDQRLVFAGAAVRPQRFDGSKVGDFENFAPGTTDSDPIAYSIDSNQVNGIRWLSSTRDLLIGTLGGEFRARGDTESAPLTPTNVSVKRQTAHGSSDMPPIEAYSSVLFVQRQNRKLRELAYTIEAEGYRAPDMTIRADHIMRDGVISLAYQQEPWSIVWACRKDGTLLGFTYQRDESVTAWHRHPMAGAVVEAVSVIPGAGFDQLWMVVRRTINGVSRRYIEVLEDPLQDDQAASEAVYVDCALSYAGAAVTSISGLGHLEGELVSIWTDRGVHPRRTVNGGQVSLDFAVTRAAIGLPATWRLWPMRFEAGAQAGAAQGQTKRVDQVVVRLYRSTGVRIGRDELTLDEVPIRTAEDLLGAAPQLISGDRKINFNGRYDTDGSVLLQGSDPGPVTVVAMIPRVTTNEG